jgi:hypothetical protein
LIVRPTHLILVHEFVVFVSYVDEAISHAKTIVRRGYHTNQKVVLQIIRIFQVRYFELYDFAFEQVNVTA